LIPGAITELNNLFQNMRITIATLLPTLTKMTLLFIAPKEQIRRSIGMSN